MKNLFKKSMSVLLSVLMLMSCWVWVPGKHNHASAVSVDASSVASYAEYHVEVKITDTGSGHVILRYHPINADGTVNTSVTDEYVLVNSFNAYSDGTYTFKTADDSTRNLSSDTSAETGTVKGWPCGIRWKGKLHSIKIGGVTVLNEGTWTASSERSLTYDDSAWGSSYNANWKVPTATSLTAPASMSFTAPEVGSSSNVTKTTTATLYDQYGVKMPVNSDIGYNYGISNNTATGYLGVIGFNATVSSGVGTLQMTINQDVQYNLPANSTDGRIVYQIQAYYGSVYSSWADVIIQCPKYNVNYVKANNGGTTTVAAGYYNGSYTTSATPTANTATKSNGSGASDTHTVYTWPAAETYTITGHKTVNEIATTSAHSWDEGVANPDSTCTAKGTKTYTCTVCGQTRTEEIALKSHTLAVTEYKAPTCTQEGNIAYWHCSVCDKYFSDATATTEIGKAETVLGITSHTPGADATCTTAQTCTVCSTVLVTATGHTAVTDAAVEATCTTPGKTEGSHCSVCSAVLVAQQTVAALGHLDANNDHVCDRNCGVAQGTCSDSATDGDHVCDYGCGKVLEACTDADGDGNHKCDICNADNVTAHTKGSETKENIIEATCGSAGKYDSVYYCTECNTELERINDVTIAQLPHDWQEATYSWSDDGKSCTATRTCANNAAHTETETVNATGVQNVAPTCEDKGSTLYTAEFEATWATKQTKEVYDIPANDHTPAEALTENNVPATCTTDGSYDTVIYCLVEGCKKELSRVKTTVPATGHTAGAAATCTTAQTCTVCSAVLTAALNHNYKSVVTSPTCTAEGYTTYTCTRCDDTYTDNKVAALGHTWTAADCTTPKTCSVCDATEGEALGHTWVVADCTTPKTCSVCKATEGKALGHTWTAADCTTPKTCSVCKATEGEALGHTWTAADCTTPKTCSVCKATEGEALGHTWVVADCTTPKTCSVCDATEGEALGHTWVAATCTTPKTCSVCKATEGEKLAHDYKAVVTAPTCTAKGYTTHTCSACGDSYVDTYTGALDHAWSDTYTMESDGKDGKHYQTCTRENCSVKNTAVAHTWNDGLENPEADCENAGTMNYACTAEGCGATYTESVNPDGHSFGEWVTETPATCVATGTKGHYECTVCHKYFESDKTTVIADLTIEIDSDKHDLKTTAKKDPTCTEIGWDEYVTCQREGCGYTTYEEKGNLGHAYGDWTYDADGQHKRVCANDTNHVETEACADSSTDNDCLCDKCDELVAHSYGDASCDAPATCTVCGATTGNKLGHDYTVFVETIDYTCTTDGYTVYKCTRCDSTENRDITNAAHRAEADYTVIKKATCKADGYKAILCSECDAELETAEIAKREHVYKDNGVQKEATCLAAGVMNTICENVETATHEACTHESTREIPQEDHSYTGEYKWDSSVKTHTQKCVNGCNEYNPTVTACTFDKVVTDPTCFVNGYTTYTCSVCKNSYDADFTTRAHIYVYATGNGTSHEVTCQYDNCAYTATENCSGGTATCIDKAICEKCNTAWGEKAAANHTGEANVIKNYKKESCSEEGYTGDIHWSCCDALERNGSTVPMLAHTEATREENKIPASCSADGSYDLVTYCSVCKDVIKTEEKTIPATGEHNYATETDREEPTCQDKGYYVMACGCGATKTYELDTVDHKYETYTGNGDATCQKNATETAECSFGCGTEDTRAIANSTVDHKYTAYKSDNNEKCEEDGTKTALCDYGCGTKDTVTDADSALEHDMQETSAKVEPKCEVPGKEAVYTCANGCGKTEGGKEIAALEHNMQETSAKVEPKCEVPGKEAVYTCANGCGKTEGGEEIAALEHDMQETSAKVEPKCEVPGKEAVYTCANGCGKTEGGETIPTSGHNMLAGEVVAPTCDAEGYTVYTCANNCGETENKDFVNAIGHDYSSKVTLEPTCNSQGIITYTCKNDASHTYMTTIPAAGHKDNDKNGYCDVCGDYTCKHSKTVIVGANDATCEFEGYSGDTVCAYCGYVVATGIVVPAKNHDWGATPVEIIPANCSSAITMVYKCRRCSETEKRYEGSADKAVHTMIALEHVEPTCEDAGYIYYVCTLCGGYIQFEEIAATGHADKDKDGYCDDTQCGTPLTPEAASRCDCLCHSESSIMRFIYKIARFFWKLFGMNKSCACGTEHY